MDLDRWVNDNPDEQLQYGKGWWDYIELIRRLMYNFGAEEAHVVGRDSDRAHLDHTSVSLTRKSAGPIPPATPDR